MSDPGAGAMTVPAGSRLTTVVAGRVHYNSGIIGQASTV